MRGKAAGATILTVRCNGSEPQCLRDLDQPRLDAADRCAREHQERPDAGEGDDRDFQSIAEAERNECDRDDRDGGDGPDQFDRRLHQPVEQAQAAEQHAEREAETGADRKAAECAEQRVARRRGERTVRERPEQRARDVGWGRDRIAGAMSPRPDLGEDDERRGEGERTRRVHRRPPASDAWMKS